MAKQLLPPQIAALERYIDPELLNASKLDPTVRGTENTRLHNFIARKSKWYIENSYFGGRLWEDFQEDFDEWTFDMLKECEKELHAWAPEEIQAQINHGGGFVSNYRPPLPRISLPPISSDQEANVASDLDFQSRDTTLGLGKVQLPQNQLTRNAQTQGLERGPHASVNKELSPKMEKENYKDKFNDLKLDELPEDRTRYNPHLDSEPPEGFVVKLTNISKL
ncbi:hypothetical protein GcC1_112008 [Golovinomyces cichoracearum]|uniref:Uncharacterized protein n=1 Tax=Golovinomyces cichoracearum TaxID=62708 RepID=A0A420I8Q4_9PEZI|nr:hypothetical protein GcC1_112008 [Golovinomyces cichoracearum]